MLSKIKEELSRVIVFTEDIPEPLNWITQNNEIVILKFSEIPPSGYRIINTHTFKKQSHPSKKYDKARISKTQFTKNHSTIRPPKIFSYLSRQEIVLLRSFPSQKIPSTGVSEIKYLHVIMVAILAHC